MKGKAIFVMLALIVLESSMLWAQHVTGEGPNLGKFEDRLIQEKINDLSFEEILAIGKRIFSTPFNKMDGFGDGPFEINDEFPREMGHRPTLQNSGGFLRLNGLDGQSCLECHFIVRNSVIPPVLGIGGIAGGANNPVLMPSLINVAEKNLYAMPLMMNPGDFNGRFPNPPFLFGSGGVELAAKEMTTRLQKLKRKAIRYPGTEVALKAKGVDFGTIVADELGNVDTSNVQGIDDDLVVRAFGRKGEFATVREIDVTALQFHFGMQPVEAIAPESDPDPDGDGVENEILPGELSALSIWATNLARPVMDIPSEEEMRGFAAFKSIGCAHCHKPFIRTRGRILTYCFPEVHTDPEQNVFFETDLTKTAGFTPYPPAGMIVPLFSDLKRHNMGPGLKESLDLVDDKVNSEFVTARLWGVRDTSPYLHDGRAFTITEAILKHDGEAGDARNQFENLSQKKKDQLIKFLYLLRTPLETEPAIFDDVPFLGKD